MTNPLDMINKSKNIAIISHVNPDGDSLGSILGLGLALKKIHTNVTIYVNDIVPGKYEFLPGLHLLKKYDNEALDEYDLTFVLDCGDINRLGYSTTLLSRSKKVFNIDHHISNNSFGDYNIVDAHASSTCELVYDFLSKELNITVDNEIATCLYVGINTDTGSFKYDNTSPSTHIVTAHLLEAGINIEYITYNLYQNNSISNMKFLGHVLSHLALYLDDKVAIVDITDDLIEKYSIDAAETDSIINYARDIKGIEVAITLRELEEDLIKISLRAKGDFDVNKLANIFGGGGHKKASGAVIRGSIDNVRESILNEIKKSL
ncbi:DHH family phosphoesterase [Alkaliphilus peptidifermentans]|uniref:Phosphoesterase RecJ domain-containing protein n=1 Tax=Alkaliphilus peptidifermentans DSM 18978 TaxID=1120976 RepID=A0A1G5DCV7_9FIRM|nr:bifunctional oligoribonuclease/PAP phosphatase NrnA [Alkaliphilus peptidifermentans]SCY12361.1 phosphoesterase RecJ domain-containing protein [Alkaliphilus peptidifermentans DSM 18978]